MFVLNDVMKDDMKYGCLFCFFYVFGLGGPLRRIVFFCMCDFYRF